MNIPMFVPKMGWRMGLGEGDMGDGEEVTTY